MANLTLRRSEAPAVSRMPSLLGGWDPFRRMERLLEWDPFRELAPFRWPVETRAFSPDFEVRETQNEYVFKADLPGVKESDIDISLRGRVLTISGKREEEEKEEAQNYYCYERTYGAFSRSFTLPEGVDDEHIRADLKEGVLSILLPKRPELQARKIALEGAERGKKPSA